MTLIPYELFVIIYTTFCKASYLVYFVNCFYLRKYAGQKSNDKSYDLAVLIVDQPFPINDFIRPACLPAVGWAQKIRGGNMIISGMGRVGSRQSQNVKIATIPMKSKSECKNNLYIGRSFRGKVYLVYPACVAFTLRHTIQTMKT